MTVAVISRPQSGSRVNVSDELVPLRSLLGPCEAAACRMMPSHIQLGSSLCSWTALKYHHRRASRCASMESQSPAKLTVEINHHSPVRIKEGQPTERKETAI